MGKHLFIAKIIWHQQRAEIFPVSQEGVHAQLALLLNGNSRLF